jgi:hypothetical protein
VLFLPETSFLSAFLHQQLCTRSAFAGPSGKGPSVEGIEVRTRMRARAGLTVLDRGFDDRLGDDVPQVPRLWGEHGPLGGGPTNAIPLARRAAGQASDEGRDVVAERDQIKAAVHRAHQRRARRRPLLTRIA